MIEGSKAREKSVACMHTPNIRAPRYIKQRLIDPKREVDANIIRTVAFNFILSAVDPGRETAELSDNPNFWYKKGQKCVDNSIESKKIFHKIHQSPWLNTLSRLLIEEADFRVIKDIHDKLPVHIQKGKL